MSQEEEITIDRFTMCPDSLVEQYGLVTAAVYGQIWRYCRMREKNCHAKIETIAKKLSLNRITVMRHILVLERDGYIIDKTPNLRNHPHTYKVTRKITIKIAISAVAESDT